MRLKQRTLCVALTRSPFRARAIVFVLLLKSFVYSLRIRQLLTEIRRGNADALRDFVERLPKQYRPRGLAALPSDGMPPLAVTDLPLHELVRMAQLVLPAYAFLALPSQFAWLYVSAHPAWRPWFLVRSKAAFKIVLLLEFLIMGTYTDGVIWYVSGRITLWPNASIITSTACDICAATIAHEDVGAYMVGTLFKWTTLNLAMMVLPFDMRMHWASLNATIVGIALALYLPLQQHRQRRRMQRDARLKQQ